VARVVVDVMLKPEILDPQGQAVQRALPRLGFEGIADVRQGKRFELEVAGPVDGPALARIHAMAETFLANTVIEDFVVKIEDEPKTAESAGTAEPGESGKPGETGRTGKATAGATATAEGSK
jgi:phosphoribosylformylglycinamidine synthase subunit PurS